MFKDLDPLLQSQVRLAIMSLLLSVITGEFSYSREDTKTTRGNLSFQLTKLNEAEYIEIKKSVKGNYPLTTCSITPKGITAYEATSTLFQTISKFPEYRIFEFKLP